eukprot:196907-Chlamydomonas_euryale.AAC.1
MAQGGGRGAAGGAGHAAADSGRTARRRVIAGTQTAVAATSDVACRQAGRDVAGGSGRGRRARQRAWHGSPLPSGGGELPRHDAATSVQLCHSGLTREAVAGGVKMPGAGNCAAAADDALHGSPSFAGGTAPAPSPRPHARTHDDAATVVLRATGDSGGSGGGGGSPGVQTAMAAAVAGNARSWNGSTGGTAAASDAAAAALGRSDAGSFPDPRPARESSDDDITIP